MHPCRRADRALLLLFRLLRNCLALEPEQTGPTLAAAGLHECLPTAAQLLAGPQLLGEEEEEDSAGALLLLDCALAFTQMVANCTGTTQGAALVWDACFPHTWQLLAGHRSARARVASTLALYHCCRSDVRHSRQLCDQGGGIPAALIQSTLPGSDSSLQQQQQQQQPANAPEATANEWLPLLVSCIAVRQGLLSPLTRGLESPAASTATQVQTVPALLASTAAEAVTAATAASGPLSACNHARQGHEHLQANGGLPSRDSPVITSSDSAPTARGTRWVWSPLHPPLLHLLAHELSVMKDATPVGTATAAAGPSGGTGCSGTGGAGTAPAVQQQQPWQAALSTVVDIVESAARASCAPDRGEEQRELARHVLEAGFEVLKSLVSREDQGCQLFGSDPLDYLVGHHRLLHLMLAMLHSLQPIHSQRSQTKQRQQAQMQQRSAAATSRLQEEPAAAAAASSGDVASAAESSSSGAASQPPPPLHTDLACLVRGLPVHGPYVGYRGDVLAVLSNALFGRPAIADLVMQLGCVELLLAQCQVDEWSPLSREWALWAVRNLCAGSAGAQKHIQDLEVVSSVETPELEKLGMRLELDKQTGKMKLVRIDA